ncbi:MAG: M20/M25/M40 family metallo-hydrolase, partial [Synergistes sp.]|nr:M20/M25/M40 family metallo-hydrolase [Synergistes sp.]
MDVHQQLSSLGASVLSDAENISNDMQEWRRDFHQFPELALEENLTASKIKRVLKSIPGMEVYAGFAVKTCVIGVLGAEKEGPALMLRAVMDADAGDEQTGLPFSSCVPGVFHSAGHDAEMASLLGAAAVLSKYQDRLRQKTVFLFQPSGSGRSGAKILTENNIIEKFDIGRAATVSWAPDLAYGELFMRRGVMTALSDKLHIDIRGTTGHAAAPHTTVDP